MNNVINNPKVKANNDTESKKIESTRETITNTETSKSESKKDSKNKNEVRLDFNGDEIVYKIKPKYYFLNTLTHIIILVLCVILLCAGVFTDIFTTLLVKIVWSIFFGFSIYHIYNTLFGMVCFYVTNIGIGFKRRRLFGIQKNFLNLEKSK